MWTLRSIDQPDCYITGVNRRGHTVIHQAQCLALRITDSEYAHQLARALGGRVVRLVPKKKVPAQAGGDGDG